MTVRVKAAAAMQRELRRSDGPLSAVRAPKHRECRVLRHRNDGAKVAAAYSEQVENEMTILRRWAAEIRLADRDRYIDYVRRTGFDEYSQTWGNLGAMMLTRQIDAERAEIVTLSLWESETSIAAFAGDPIDKAHYYPEDDEFLLTRPDKVEHFRVDGASGIFAQA